MRSVPRLLVGYDQETKSTLRILPYPVDLLWAKSTDVLSCMPSLEVVMIRLSGNLLEGLQEVV
jgi:hypothetical protein